VRPPRFRGDLMGYGESRTIPCRRTSPPIVTSNAGGDPIHRSCAHQPGSFGTSPGEGTAIPVTEKQRTIPCGRRRACGALRRGFRVLLASVLIAVLRPEGSAAAEAPDISMSWLTGGIYLVEDRHFVATNSLVYIGTSSVTVIGATWTPDTARQLAGLIRSFTRLPITEVLDTSPDPEWSGGNAYWRQTGATVIAARATCLALARTWRTTVERFRASHPEYPSLTLTAPTKCESNRFALQHGAVRALYLGPSHTSADIFAYFPNEKVLDAGSILKPFLGNMTNANIEQYPKTLKKLQGSHLDIRMIVSGHWSPVHGPDLVDRYLKLLAESRFKISPRDRAGSGCIPR
jgi:metallo-beta-lactamase class B